MTQQELKQLLHYDQDTGIFTWLTSNGNCKSKTIAGYLHPLGYVDIQINKKHYKSHRLAWLYTHGKWPSKFIDHINGIKNDNRLCNLREATLGQNTWNTPSRSASKVKGLYWIPSRNRYKISFYVDGKPKHFGYFKKEEFEEAKKIAIETMSKIHGEYVNYR
jgi:hypothetical protein